MRRGGPPTLAAALLLACGMPARALDAVPAALRECQERLDPELDIGFARISAHCPGLVRVLEQSPWAPWLPQGWRDPRNDLSAGSLGELGVLLQRERGLAPLRTAPAGATLRAVLAELGYPRRERMTLWERLRDWLHLVSARRQSEPAPSWLSQVLRQVDSSGMLLRVMSYMAIAAVLVLGVSGFVRRLRTKRLSDTLWHADHAPPAPVPGRQPWQSWREVEQASLAERPALMLGLVLDALVQSRRLPRAESFTASELIEAAESTRLPGRERLVALARVAEQARFGSKPLPASQLAAAVEGGRTLLAELNPPGRVSS